MSRGSGASAQEVLDPQVRQFVERCSADYARYGPFDRLPIAEARQVAEAVRAPLRLAGQGAALGVDPARIVLGGDSAGGNLAMAACLGLRDEGSRQHPAVAGLLLNYAGFEPDCSDEAARLYGGEGFMLTRAEVRNFWAHYLRTAADERDPRASLARADLKGLPPVRLTIAECDVLAEQNLQMARRLKDAAVRVTSRVYPGATHSFLEAVAISQLAERALQEGADWLRALTRMA